MRIEDTDQTRLVPGAIEKLQEDLAWAGIYPDEGPGCSRGACGPYKQSERKNLYKQEIQKLIDSGHAYYCFCSEHRLELLRKEALRTRQVPKYDNKCRHLSKEEVEQKLSSGAEACIRFKLQPGEQTHDDLVYGRVSHDVASIESDPVVLKTDGMPTYHLANVIDDHHMSITHVLRGVEWQPSTAKHLLLYKAFGWNPPTYAHLPLLVNSDGAKLSKRHGDMSVDAFRRDGILARALVNFVFFTGGFASVEGTVHQPRTFSVKQLVDIFNMKHVNTHPCRLNFSQLPEFNRAEFVRVMTAEKNGMDSLVQQLKTVLREKFKDSNECELDLDNDQYLKSMLEWSFTRITRFRELTEPQMMFLWMQPSLEQLQNAVNPNQKDSLHELVINISKLEEYSEESLKALISDITKKRDVKYNHFMKTLRLCLSGLKVGPGVIELMTVLGKDCVLRRLKRSLQLGENEVQQQKAR